ncbi:MAG: acyltransferase [Bacteroidetes bacterium]|nr:acyltransferase [Bacteroidota bacterium]
MLSLQVERKHFPALDGLRGAAILLVVIYHNFGFIQEYFFFGWIGVDLFFTLSGFLITDILLKTVLQPNYLRNFYIRRALRIFPLYYTALILFLIILPRFNTPLNLNYYVNNQEYIWTYLQNWLYIFKPTNDTSSLTHLWSLAVEEQFYLLWPFVILLIRNPKYLLITVSVILLSIIGLRLWAWLHHVPGLSYYNLYTFSRIDGICIGSMIAILLRINPNFLTKYTSFIVLFFAAINFVFFFINRSSHFFYPYLAIVGYTTFAMLLGLLVNQAITKETKLINLIFNFSPLRFIGKVSYGFYIFHWPMYIGFKPLAISWLSSIFNPWYSEFIYSIAISLVALLLSWLSFNYFERPFLKMKDKFA